jgi:hypothetical protein
MELQTAESFDVAIKVSNFLGQTLFEKSSHCNNGYLQEGIPLDEKFSSGIYFVKVSSDQQEWSAPLMIER